MNVLFAFFMRSRFFTRKSPGCLFAFGAKAQNVAHRGRFKKVSIYGEMFKETRNESGLSQDGTANAMKISRRKLQSIEANEALISVDDIVELAKLYKVDARKLNLESYVDVREEQIWCKRYGSFLQLFDQLFDRSKEDVVWVVKQRINGYILYMPNAYIKI